MIGNVEEVDEELRSSMAKRAAGGEWLIRARNLRKKYCRDLRRSLWYSLIDVVGALGQSHRTPETLRPAEFWAVDGVSFELRRGDCLGLLGRNGAGKSTLIKLITGQRTLTAGLVETRGRVVALTELGLGFDPVLTGRENAYINAAVHGVTRRAFDELIEKIIDFSELREFIDSAVHTYSTGMKARLGFSIGTHLSPDILIVDEVLAVGDLDFRRKCVQHVLEYLRSGGSVVLVAHDPYLVQSVCNRAIILQRGQVVFDGSAVEGANLHFRMGHANQYAEAVKSHSLQTAAPASPEIDPGTNELPPNPAPATSNESARVALSETRQVVLDRISILPVEGESPLTDRPARVTFYYRSLIEVEAAWSFTILTRDLRVAIASCASGYDGELRHLKPGEHTLSCLIPELMLHPGVYALRGGISDPGHRFPLATLGYIDAPHFFTVVPAEASTYTNYHAMMNDLVAMKVEWLQ